ncbi:unnamed protein product [[Actinomadura] parvosata subsp. kistnae]|uniref:Tc toxin subunit A n=1 Tax=[Actinomadura] parvosata TaxID=1955412 RepID=UPI000D29B3E8|nr:unnamed protein product [Actinomadura parvosata subsp. kistnae]
MAGTERLPSYQELFDDTELDPRQEDAARTVYSPGAYLADLLKLLETVLDRPSLLADDRRADLKRILLDADNTFGESPYLDIVIELLEGLAGDRPFEDMLTLEHPFGMPFSLEEERFKTYLRHLRVGPDELYRVFAPVADADTVARLFLGLSAQAVQHLTAPADEARIKAFYGLELQDPLAPLARTETFRQVTGLTMLHVRELLGDPDDPARPAKDSFTNRGGTPVTLSADGTELRGTTSGWYDRVSRIVRLSRWTGLGLADLDRVLTTCCGGTLDAAALRATALVVHLQRGYDLTVDEVCGLVTAVEPVPEDLPAVSGDLLGPHNKDYRRRLALAIGTSEADIAETVRRYRDRYDALEPSPFDRGPSGRRRSRCCAGSAGSPRRSAGRRASCSTCWACWRATRRCGGTPRSRCWAGCSRSSRTASASWRGTTPPPPCGWRRRCSRSPAGCRRAASAPPSWPRSSAAALSGARGTAVSRATISLRCWTTCAGASTRWRCARPCSRANASAPAPRRSCTTC